MALRLGGVRITLVVFSLLLLIAIVLGVIRTQARQNDARFAEQENRLVTEIFQDVLQGTLDSAEATGENSTRKTRITKELRMTARLPYLVSHAQNLWNVSLFPSPLSALSVGASNKWPHLYRIRGMSLSKTVQRSDEVRPVASVYGPFDTTFVVMAIAPLVVIGLTFNASSRDRESALQNLIVAQTPRLEKLIAVRCFVRASLVIVLMTCVVNGTLLIAFGRQFDVNVVVNLAIWNVVAALYLLIWAALSLFVNSFAWSSSANGAALLLLWLIFVLIIPRTVSNAVEQAVPTFPESKLVEREKRVVDQATENVDELLRRFQSEHPEIKLPKDDEQQKALAGYLLAHSEAGRKSPETINSHYAAQLQRARYLGFCNWVSPAISFRNQSDQCSGNSERAFIAFTVHAGEVQAEVAEVFLHPSIANQECTIETIAELPNFQESEIPKRPLFLNSVQSIAPIVLWLTILVSLGTRRFRAKSLSEERRLPKREGVESA